MEMFLDADFSVIGSPSAKTRTPPLGQNASVAVPTAGTPAQVAALALAKELGKQYQDLKAEELRQKQMAQRLASVMTRRMGLPETQTRSTPTTEVQGVVMRERNERQLIDRLARTMQKRSR